MQLALGYGDLRLVADLLAEQPLGDRAGGEDAVVVRVVLAGADELELLLVAVVEVLDAHPRPEHDRPLGELTAVDDVGAADAVLQLVDPRLEHALVLAGGVVLGVLAEVAHVAGVGHPLGHLNHLGVLLLVEFGPELVVAFAGHRDAVFGHCQIAPARSPGASRDAAPGKPPSLRAPAPL